MGPVTSDRRGQKIQPYSVAPWAIENTAASLEPVISVCSSRIGRAPPGRFTPGRVIGPRTASQVLATPSPPEKLWVRWPGGKVTTTTVPANCREITVNIKGKSLSSR